MLTVLVLALAGLAAGGLTYTLVRRPRRPVDDETDEIFQDLMTLASARGRHRRG